MSGDRPHPSVAPSNFFYLLSHFVLFTSFRTFLTAKYLALQPEAVADATEKFCRPHRECRTDLVESETPFDCLELAACSLGRRTESKGSKR